MNIQIVDSAKPLTEADIAHAEQRMGRSIPPAYRSFLLVANGGYPKLCSFQMHSNDGSTQRGCVDWFLGIDVKKSINLEHFVDTYRDRIPSSFFPIARDPGGNLICISVNGADAGKIYFWDHEFEAEEGETPTYDNLYFIANSFEEFIDNLNESP